MKRDIHKVRLISRNQKEFREKLLQRMSVYNKSTIGNVGWKNLSLEMVDREQRGQVFILYYLCDKIRKWLDR